MGDILFSPTAEQSLREMYAVSSVVENDVEHLITFSSTSSSSDDGPETSPVRRAVDGTESLIISREFVPGHRYIDYRDSDHSELPQDPMQMELNRAECRAQFWESYAKQFLLILHVDQYDDRTSAENQTDEKTQSSEDRLNDMAIQMRELGNSLNQLKMHGEEEEKRIQFLEAELKRTERIKNSYKKEITSLKSLLEDNAKHVVARPQHDAAVMQSKISSLRIHVESLKGRVDKVQAEKNVLQGEHEELKDRCSRREEALDRAQKRCRDLEIQIKHSSLPKDNASQQMDKDVPESIEAMPLTVISTRSDSCEDEECSLPPQSSPLSNSSVSLSHTSTEKIEYIDASTWMEETDNLCISEEEPILSPRPMEEDTRDRRAEDHREEEVEEETLLCDSMIHETLYKKVFGDVNVSNAELVILKADETLERCTSSINLLLEKLKASEDEANQLQSLCADQYDQIYSFKNTCSHLHAKKVHLEKYIARLEQSSSEYQDQMEHLLANQRQAAAQESHHLHQELQLMSEEQARLLVKLQASENDLVKARALCRQLSSSTTRTVEQHPDAEDDQPSSPEDNGSTIPSAIYPCLQKQMPAHGDSPDVVQRLQTIAQGLKSISSSGTVEYTKSM